MQSFGTLEMLILVLYFATCLSYAGSSDAGTSMLANNSTKIGNATSGLIKNAAAVDGARDKRTPSAKPTSQLFSPSESAISKRQFMPMVPDMPRREFLPRREFETASLLPTPRIITPLEIDRPGFPLEGPHFIRRPMDLERRPFVGQGLLGPPLLPEFRRIGLHHRPLFREVGPRLVPLNPELEPKHIFLEPHRNEFLNLPPPRLGDEASHFGSLGDSPLLPLPRRHHLAEGFIAPQVPEALPEGGQFQEALLPELRHRFRNVHPRPLLPEGLISRVPNRARENSQLRHRLQELEQLSSRLHHLQPRPTKPSFVAPDTSDVADESSDNSDGDDSIENMMNELNKHKSGKAWVTDVNIYDKKRKNEDLSSFLEADNKDDDDADFDPCAGKPCKNRAICRAKAGGNYECICTRNFKGRHCTVRNRCFPNPCRNRGRCTETVAGFECTCAIGFKGTRCSEKNYCLPNPCMNDGLCNESPDGYVCTCGQGFQGKLCEVKRTACNPNPCLNNAQCIVDNMKGFQCVCLEGYGGRTCDVFGQSNTLNGVQRSAIAIPDSSIMACLNNPCMNNGLCRPDPLSDKGFKCVCVSEYKGILCEEKLCKCENNGFCITQTGQSKCICKAGYAGNQCESHTQCNEDTCMHGGICIEEVGSFKCKCDDGYKGQRCEALNHCSPNPCLHGGTCKDLRDTYQCECPNTYKGKQCEDFNFCFPNPCQNGGTCFGYSGGFQCDCPNGFTGKNCENKLYCNSNPCKNAGQCVEIPGSFKCLCGKGFSGSTCDVHNYCASNPCRNGGTCLNQANGYKCTCSEHFIGNNCETFNECFETPCKNGGKCEMQPHGDLKCTCTIGFAGPRCEQIDECQPNPCKNDGLCRNNPSGGFTCNCKEGFRGLVCAEPDPCHPNPCHHGVCAEINGGYVCNCTLGFRGPVCQEIDRCNPNPCQHSAFCEEINGGVGYVCQCPVGYKGQICNLKDPCNPSPCLNSGSCMETFSGSGYTCKCPQGWIGDKCSDKDPCFPSPCQHGALCQNDGKNAFKCNCTLGFKGDSCERIDLCSPNPCRFGSHCIQTDEESYQCVKNLCTPNPCKHNGKCIVVNDEGFECACHDGWRGRNCEDYDPCYSNPCLNGGTCSENSNGGGFNCMCSKDFEGKYCGDAKVKAKPEARWCTKNPCTNGGTCIETDGAYNCRCPIGFSGTICEESVCSPNPCENGGLCVPYYGIALCKCTHDYTGAHCSEKKRVSAADATQASASKPSQYNYVPASPISAQAVTRGLQQPNIVTLPSFSPPSQYEQIEKSVLSSAATQPGATQQSALQVPITPQAQFAPQAQVATQVPITAQALIAPQSVSPQSIAPLPATKMATLISQTFPAAKSLQALAQVASLQSSFSQTSPAVVSNAGLPVNAKARTDVSERPGTTAYKKDDSCVPSPCQHNGMCVMRTDNSPECVCPTDFSGPHCEEIGTYGYSSAPKFFPKDECSHCDESAVCVNSHCICKQGFVGDGLECWAETSEDKNWSCDQNPCQNGGTCKYGRAKCVCRLGYTGDYCQNYCPPLVHLSFDKMKGALALDESGNNNDAMLINGAELAYEGGKCDSGVTLSGGDILFDGERFWPKPVEAVTIALWVKLDTNKGIQSIFDTVGQKYSNHKEGQYHVEIENGKVRWFHRNEKHVVVFSIISQPLVSDGLWHHIAGTYDAQKSIAKLFLNGDLVAKGPGNGYLSQDWTGKAGIGKHEHPYGDRLLRGTVDEFFIFGCALPRLEILVLMHHCKLYFGKKKDYSKAAVTSVKQSTKLLPADHWSYTVAENMHIKGDTRTGIQRPGEAKAQRSQQQRQQQQSNRLPARQKVPAYEQNAVAARPKPNQRPVNSQGSKKANAKPGVMDFKALWEAWKEKKREEAAAKKTLTTEESMIETLYQKLFGNKKSQQIVPQNRNNFYKPSEQVAPREQAVFRPYSQQHQQQVNQLNAKLLARERIEKQQSWMNQYYLNNNQQNVPSNPIAQYQREMNRQFYKAEQPSYMSGQVKSTMPNSAVSSTRRTNTNMGYNVAMGTKTLAPVAPMHVDISRIGKQSFFRPSPQQNGINRAAKPVQNNYKAAVQTRRNMPASLQRELQRLRELFGYKRTPVAAPVATPVAKPAAATIPHSPSKWPAPNSVEEFATNRGIVRIQSVIRPLANNNKAQVTKYQVQKPRENSLVQRGYNNPWNVYNQLKSQMSSKRDNFKAADSHASTAATSNTWEHATAPGQKGAGHNYGYGYGYGTGDQLKGGGWGQGFGGGGPGVNENGNHHTPDFNNPKMKWGQGQGWGQGGKGVEQQTQNRPAPPSPPSGSSFYPKREGGASRAPVRHVVQSTMNTRRKNPLYLPKGPSIMNFEPTFKDFSKNQNVNSNLFSRGNTPVSSPAYQVKYFMGNQASMDYPEDSVRSVRNEIISNAVADVLRSIQKKKKKKKRTTK